MLGFSVAPIQVAAALRHLVQQRGLPVLVIRVMLATWVVVPAGAVCKAILRVVVVAVIVVVVVVQVVNMKLQRLLQSDTLICLPPPTGFDRERPDLVVVFLWLRTFRLVAWGVPVGDARIQRYVAHGVYSRVKRAWHGET